MEQKELTAKEEDIMLEAGMEEYYENKYGNLQEQYELYDIFISEIRKAGLYEDVWQSFAVLLCIKSVGVMGDERTYEHVIALRCVSSTDGMTADWVKLAPEFLGKVSNRIINEVKGANRVVYDISSKPPSTIEWE